MPEGLAPIRIFSRVETVAAGLDHSLVLLQSGICFSWGCNTYGQLGNGTLVSYHVPSKVFLDGVYVGAGRSRSHVVNRLGTCFSWGRNSHGQLGVSSLEKKLVPTEIFTVRNISCLAVGSDHTLVVAAGACYAWGYNGNGRVGDGTTQMRESPTKILDSVQHVAAGHYHSLAVLVNYDCVAWGYNGNGQLGDGSRERSLRPIKVLENVLRVAAGGAHSLAVNTNGECFAWGWNKYGQLGSSPYAPPVYEDVVYESSYDIDQDKLEFGAEVEAIVAFGESYDVGDRGRVSVDFFVDEADGGSKFGVTWYRSGLTSTMLTNSWQDSFVLTRAKLLRLRLGDKVEVLPGIGYELDGKEYYSAGDRGRVSQLVQVEATDGIERCAMTWTRTGLTTTMKKERWLKNFRFIERGKEAPDREDELEVLPGASLTFDGQEYYIAGDIGIVVDDVSMNQKDGIERFTVEWYRTGLSCMVKKDSWLKNFCPVSDTRQ